MKQIKLLVQISEIFGLCDMWLREEPLLPFLTLLPLCGGIVTL
jgi:hypothetical protein